MNTKRLHKSLDTKTEGTDRLSELPEPIIHHIISFLPTKDATKTCSLSKRFRFLWNSFPIINFDFILYFQLGQNKGPREKLEMFLNYVRDSLQRREASTSLQKFRLHAALYESDARIYNAIRFAINSNVNELDLDVNPEGLLHRSSTFYNLPLTVFFAKSIKILKLKGFWLETLDLINPSLEYLSFIGCNGLKSFRVLGDKLKILELDSCGGLEKIDVVASNLENFSFIGKKFKPCDINITECKSTMKLFLKNATITCDCLKVVSKFFQLEILTLSECNKLKNLYFSSASLRIMVIENCSKLETIDVVALNLETFEYKGKTKPCEINIIACRFLKNLMLHSATITDQWVENNVSDLPFLENLKLSNCNVLQKIKIFCEGLKSFQLYGCNKLEEVEIKAHSMVSFQYRGNLVPSPPSIDSPYLFANLSVYTHAPMDKYWFKKLVVFLGAFGHCKELTLASMSEKILIVPRKVRERFLPPLYDIKHLKVKVGSNLENLTNLMESLLWIAPHPDTISIISGLREKSIKFHYAKPMTYKEDPYCCWLRPIKCWRHYLNEVRLENFEDVEHKRLKNFFTGNAMRLERFTFT